ncbi:MAG: hypothetical protein JSV42_15035 [Chloroflexota bacterium]|nr:MAG: hypothetical protein JSV42_15035 [Chloroflexota bacterium]
MKVGLFIFMHIGVISIGGRANIQLTRKRKTEDGITRVVEVIQQIEITGFIYLGLLKILTSQGL